MFPAAGNLQIEIGIRAAFDAPPSIWIERVATPADYFFPSRVYDSVVTFEQIVQGLRSLTASQFDWNSSDADGMDKLYELTDAAMLLESPNQVIPELFVLIERLPDADLGSPGPIVHTLEKMKGYEGYLLESLRRHPTPLTVWMVNRILNAPLSEEDRKIWLAALTEASNHPLSSEAARVDAKDFIDYQQRKA